MRVKKEAVTEEPEHSDDALESLRIDSTRKQRRHAPRRLLLGAILLAVVGVLGVSRLWKAPIGVEVARVIRLDPSAATTVLTAGGYIVPQRKSELSPKITGRIEWIGVDRGDHVETGQILIRLDQQESKAQVKQARSNFDVAKARLKVLLAGSRDEEVKEARAAVEQARSDLAIAELNLKRMRKLLQQEFVARQPLDEAQNQYEIALSKLEAAQERFRMVKTGPTREQIEVGQAEIRQAEANLEVALANLEDTLIRAPFDGTILERLVELGETVTTGIVSQRGAKSAILSMADLRDLQVVVDVSQNDLNKLRLEMAALVIPDAYADRSYDGFLAEIAPEANRQKATLQVKVQVTNPDQFIRPEMGARVLFQEPPKDPKGAPRIFVPKEVVVSRGESHLVYVIRDGKAIERPVTLGSESGGNIEVEDGLRGDEMVATRGATVLRDGQAVRTTL